MGYIIKSRSIENMSYCVGVNKLGQMARIYFILVTHYDYMGEKWAQPKQKSKTHTVKMIEQNVIARQKLNFLNDRDRFYYSIVKVSIKSQFALKLR